MMAAFGWLAFAAVWVLISVAGGGIRAVFALSPAITALVGLLFPRTFGLFEQALLCVLLLGVLAAAEGLMAHIEEVRSQRDGRAPPPVQVRLPPPREVPLSPKALRLQQREAAERRRRQRDEDLVTSDVDDEPHRHHHHAHGDAGGDSDD